MYTGARAAARHGVQQGGAGGDGGRPTVPARQRARPARRRQAHALPLQARYDTFRFFFLTRSENVCITSENVARPHNPLLTPHCHPV